MKMQIAVENSEQVAGVDRCAVLSLEFGELIDIAFGDGERENADGHDLQLLAHCIDLSHLLRREVANNGATARNTLDNSLLSELQHTQSTIPPMGLQAPT